jgi:hypothetical protein
VFVIRERLYAHPVFHYFKAFKFSSPYSEYFSGKDIKNKDERDKENERKVEEKIKGKSKCEIMVSGTCALEIWDSVCCVPICAILF